MSARALALAAVALAVPLGVVACLHDFDAFDSVADGSAAGSGTTEGGDEDAATGASPTLDASKAADGDAATATFDAGSSCGADCRLQATSCAGTCAQIEQSCAAPPGCDGGSCLSTCETQESSCASQCVTACETCTSDEGCVDPKGCAAAAP